MVRVKDPDSGAVLAELLRPFVDGLGVTGASIAVFDSNGGQSTICTSDGVAARIDELQFELGEGPQWVALKTGVPTLVPDVAVDSHESWPIFGASVQSLDVGALFAFPLLMGAVTVGAVVLYRQAAGGLSPQRMEVAASLASAVAGIAVRRAVADASEDSASESTMAPSMRREVHQATGMIVAQLGVSATIAYSRLQAYAFSTGRSVLELAHKVVIRELDFRFLPR
ncbi:MAG: GAF and ANTAR domain-containing protein [Kineosporiaceae bacterium]|nr:GAF and ANTAR domain-containing protein [Aeromicrobium sp.]